MKTEDIPSLPFADFAAKYCERQESTPEQLLNTLRAQMERYQPLGWVLLEAQLFDSSYFGSLTVLPYGPNNTYKEIPNHPLSPRGLGSDTSVVVAVLLVEALPK